MNNPRMNVMMNGPFKQPKKMPIYKPYKLDQEPVKSEEAKTEQPRDETAPPDFKQMPPPQHPPGNMMQMMGPPMGPPPMGPPMGSSAWLPYPPPSMLSLYQIVATGAPVSFPPATQPKPADLPSPTPDGTPPGPGAVSVSVSEMLGAQPQPAPTPTTKTKPHTVHEYYDQHAFQWREFNPEDTVVGDASDPFIVYFRYSSKSIGARRTAWILPKHAGLIKSMQDCLPDFDWRTGEDMLVKAKSLYLRRKSLEDAVGKLKRGESIGPITKAAMEKDQDKKEGENLESKEEEAKKEGETEKQVGEKEDGQTVEIIEIEDSKCDTVEVHTVEVIPDSPSSITTEVPAKHVKPASAASQKTVETEDGSDTTSTDYDIPPTPAETDTSTPNSDTQVPDLVAENVREAIELRETSSDFPQTVESAVSGPPKQDVSPEKPKEEETPTTIESLKKPEGVDFPWPPAYMLPNGIPPAIEEKVEVVSPNPQTPEELKTMDPWEMLQMVLNWVCKEFSTDEEALARQLANKEISYRFLWLYFVPGTLISLQDPISKQQMAARIESTEYMPANIAANTPNRLEICTKIIDANGTDFIYTNVIAYINEYDAAKILSELPVQILTPDLPLYETFKERGRKFVELNGVHYMTLDGIIIVNRGRDILRVRSKTRVMVDCKSFRESNPSYHHSFSGLSLVDLLHPPGMPGSYPRYPPLPGNPMAAAGSIPGHIASTMQPKDIKTVPEEELVLCAPTVFGYAFTEKAWVQMTVEGLSPIVWDTEAYNKLVLPDDTKKLVKSLVQACRTDTKLIKDIVSTKGSGVVFVLHGEPGTGKTLTAEAIGEELRRPILVIAVSDLGTEPTNVELRLGNFLRTAEKWDSIVLLDEADIFLEQRARQDIFRNAMVGVFLRLLEYHNSPMFLTTNRVFAFDPAIRSRISIAIKYHPLKRVARKQVWQQLLDMANATISPHDLDEVSMSQVNGREIKNTIRSAQALAVADGTELAMKHIKTVLDVQREFREDFEGLPGLWNGMGVS